MNKIDITNLTKEEFLKEVNTYCALDIDTTYDGEVVLRSEEPDGKMVLLYLNDSNEGHKHVYKHPYESYIVSKEFYISIIELFLLKYDKSVVHDFINWVNDMNSPVPFSLYELFECGTDFKKKYSD